MLLLIGLIVRKRFLSLGQSLTFVTYQVAVGVCEEMVHRGNTDS